MKHIIKTSIVDLDSPIGTISNTRNIKDKIKNTYSAKIIEEILAESESALVAITDEEIDEIIV